MFSVRFTEESKQYKERVGWVGLKPVAWNYLKILSFMGSNPILSELYLYNNNNNNKFKRNLSLFNKIRKNKIWKIIIKTLDLILIL